MTCPTTEDQLKARVAELQADEAETWLWEQTLENFKRADMELCRNGFYMFCDCCMGLRVRPEREDAWTIAARQLEMLPGKEDFEWPDYDHVLVIEDENDPRLRKALEDPDRKMSLAQFRGPRPAGSTRRDVMFAYVHDMGVYRFHVHHLPPVRYVYNMLVAAHAEDFVVPSDQPIEISMLPEFCMGFVYDVFRARGLRYVVSDGDDDPFAGAVLAFLGRDGVVRIDVGDGGKVSLYMEPLSKTVLPRLTTTTWALYQVRKRARVE